MKTAEEWCELIETLEEPCLVALCSVDDIKAIQLDAWKQGARDAVGIVVHLKNQERQFSIQEPQSMTERGAATAYSKAIGYIMESLERKEI